MGQLLDKSLKMRGCDALVCLWEEADDELVLWLLALDVPGHLFTTDELRDEGDDG